MHYTDIHCHILPCIDDGPSSNEGSLKMARELSENGFSHVIATPHYIDDFTPDYFHKVEKQYKLMLALIKQNDIPLKLSLGGEVMIAPYLPALAANNLLPTLNRTNYVLIETCLHQPMPYYAKEIFFNLRGQGLKPILAHPERMAVLQKNFKALVELNSMGVYFQVNLGSFMGYFGRAAAGTAWKLMQQNMIQFLASDCHDTFLLNMDKPPLRKLPLQELLMANPLKVLRDETVALESFPSSLPQRKGISSILDNIFNK